MTLLKEGDADRFIAWAAPIDLLRSYGRKRGVPDAEIERFLAGTRLEQREKFIAIRDAVNWASASMTGVQLKTMPNNVDLKTIVVLFDIDGNDVKLEIRKPVQYGGEWILAKDMHIWPSELLKKPKPVRSAAASDRSDAGLQKTTSADGSDQHAE